jgi:hypothetical protein
MDDIGYKTVRERVTAIIRDREIRGKPVCAFGIIR